MYSIWYVYCDYIVYDQAFDNLYENSYQAET